MAEEKTERIGYAIDGVFYPLVETFTMGDAILVERLAGISMEEFGERLKAREGGATLLACLIGASVSRVQRTWSIAKIERFIQHDVDLSKFEFIVPEDIEVELEGDDEPDAGGVTPIVPLPLEVAGDDAKASPDSPQTAESSKAATRARRSA